MEFLASSAEVKNAWTYTFTPPYVFMAWYFVNRRDNVILMIFRCYACHKSSAQEGKGDVTRNCFISAVYEQQYRVGMQVRKECIPKMCALFSECALLQIINRTEFQAPHCQTIDQRSYMLGT
jgi:hypothetical protein